MTDIQQLRDLLAAATPGPWIVNDDDTISLASGEKAAWRQAHRANCALIVAAVNALPDLLDEVNRLRVAVRPRYQLDELLAQCDTQAQLTREDAEWLVQSKEAIKKYE
jgi:hypothetical protein